VQHADEALKQHPTYEIATLLLSAYASYVVGESLQLSGLLAVFSSGVLIRHYHFYNISHAGAAAFTHMLATAAFLAENLIYLYLGASLVACTFFWVLWTLDCLDAGLSG
jgi:solute carrier family 9 (sodium/hydrogen exchanger), member 8